MVEKAKRKKRRVKITDPHKIPFKILIDSREQTPVLLDKIGDKNFPGLKYELATLKTGDYSLFGYDDPDCEFSVCIERKSLADLFGSTGNDRERFEREVERMSYFDHAEIVVERDLWAIFQDPPPMSEMLPKSVYRTLVAWSQRYNVKVWPCPSRAFMEQHIFITLKRFYDDRQSPKGKMIYSKI